MTAKLYTHERKYPSKQGTRPSEDFNVGFQIELLLLRRFMHKDFLEIALLLGGRDRSGQHAKARDCRRDPGNDT